MWVKNLIIKFREEYQKLSEEEQKRVSNLDDLRIPCQVDIIWLENRQFKIDFQIIIFTHFKDLKDLEITSNNPVDSQKTIETLEQILEEEKWSKRKLPEDEPYLVAEGEKNYSTLLEDVFIQAIQMFRNFISNSLLAKHTDLPIMVGKWRITKEAFCWFYIGKIQKIEVDEIVKGIIQDVKRPIKTEKPKEEKGAIKGYGTYFYPPLWIGEIPKQSFKDKILRQPMIRYSGKAFNTTYKEKIITVDKDGLIAIGEENRETAVEMLNEIMATALLLGLPTFITRELEIGEVKIDSESLKITGSQMPLISMRTKLTQERWQTFSPTFIPLERKIISKDELIEIIQHAERITRNEGIRNFLNFILESYSHFSNSEYSQSFIMSWIIVEKKLSTLWDQLMESQGIKGRRKNKLKNPASWTMDHILETLNFAGKLKEDDYKLLMELKSIRNHIVHKGKKISKPDAEKCLNQSFSVIREMINGKVK